jgi:cytochrome c oxidase subunit II
MMPLIPRTVLEAIFGFPIAPPVASSQAPRVDALFYALLLMSLFFLALIAGMLIFYAIRYREGSRADRSTKGKGSGAKLELIWISGAVVIGLIMFLWGTRVYLVLGKIPDNALTWYVTGRQWFWEIQAPGGRREINAMHIPVGQPVHLVISSEDVIHDFFIPAFRVKMDAVPGRYTSTWFTPTKVGQYHLFCSQYCGADHARMTGTVYVMSRPDYETWLGGTPEAPTAQPLGPPAEVTFRELGCDQCHRPDTDRLAPSLEGLYGSTVLLSDGSTVRADEEYIRESVLDPAAKVVRGYPAIMPTYRGLLTEEQVRLVVEAVKALGQTRPVKETRQ